MSQMEQVRGASGAQQGGGRVSQGHSRVGEGPLAKACG